MKMDNNNHSVFKLRYLLIFTTKDNRDFINPEVNMVLCNKFIQMAKGYNITLLSWDFAANHIIIRFKGHPNTQLSKFITAYKASSSRMVKKSFPELNIQSGFWAKTFFLANTDCSDGITAEYLEKVEK